MGWAESIGEGGMTIIDEKGKNHGMGGECWKERGLTDILREKFYILPNLSDT